MTSFTRRSVSGALLASSAVAGGARGQGFGSAQGLRVRRSLSRMAPGDPDLEALRTGVAWMRANPGPLSWITQRQVHAAPWGHHNSWRFLPWHRFQLYYIERVIARVSGRGDFAMPYWDWSDDHAPAAFFRGSLGDETRTITSASRISTYLGFEWETQTGAVDFWGRTDNEFGDFFGSLNPTGEAGAGFAGSAEQYGHNLIHLFVGGRMRDLMEAPLDPLFWVHHANVDRQWAIWTAIHGANPFPQEWGMEPCTGYVDQDGYLAPAHRAAECVDTRRLGYSYDDLRLAQRARTPERWFGTPDPTPARVLQADLQMQRQSPSLGRIFVPPYLLSNLKGATGPAIDAVGLIRVLGMDGYVVRLLSRSSDGSEVFARDAVFAVPMGGGMAMRPMGHRVQLEGLIPRDPRALNQGFWIEAEASRLRGEQSRMQPQLASFVLGYRSQL